MAQNLPELPDDICGSAGGGGACCAGSCGDGGGDCNDRVENRGGDAVGIWFGCRDGWGGFGVRVGGRGGRGVGIWFGAQVGIAAIEGPAQCPPVQSASATQLALLLLPPSQKGSVDMHPERGH
jgi:hypothetical protein